ncbi:MAG: hypothetical protein ACTSYB_04550 [Candidatus Helarchaeota archaeon]
MSEARRNMFEIQGAWCGFFGAIAAIVVSLILGIFNLSLLSPFPGTISEYRQYFEGLVGGKQVADSLLIVLPIIYWVTFVVGIVGVLIALFRTNLGIRFSGFIMFVTSIASLACLIGSLITLSNQQRTITELINTQGTPQELATYGITVPHILLWPAIVMSFVWFFGSIFMMRAAPFNEAKYRTKRMKILAKADTAERAGKPEEAIKLYTMAGNISMRLREEDKATEYYAKAREIREVAIQAVLEAEEKRKREELAARRAKLEEQRREILMRADKAEEAEDWARAAVIYREAAQLSVDLGEKKLAAQFTAKAKELQKRAKKARKEKEKKKAEEEAESEE